MLNFIKTVFKGDALPIQTQKKDALTYFQKNRLIKFSYQNKLAGFQFNIKNIRKKLVNAQQKGNLNDSIDYQWLKLRLGKEARHTLLAYMFLKNKPYKKVELKCDPNNKPDPERILKVMTDHCPYFMKTTIEEIKIWLEVV